MRISLVIALVAFCSVLAAADVVKMKDGRTLEGTVTRDGDRIVVDSGRIKVFIPQDEVASIAYGPTKKVEFANRLKAIDGKDLESLRGLLRWCDGQNLRDEARDVLRMILELEPDDADARARLGYVRCEGEWLTEAEVHEREGYAFFRGRWVPSYEKEKIEAEEAVLKTKQETEKHVRKLLRKVDGSDKKASANAVEELHTIDPECRLVPLTELLKSDKPSVRKFAVTELRGLGSEEAIPSLVKVVLDDRVFENRNEAFKAIQDTAPAASVPLFVDALGSATARRRINAAEALGDLDDDRVVVYLIRNLRLVWGGGPRSHIFVGDLQSYVKDYDMQVATDAVAADPQIGVVSSGIVLDAQVIRIEEHITVIERRVLSRALANLTGQDFGENHEKWSKWFQEKNKAAKKEQ